MKLSEAILLGSTLSPQAAGRYENKDGARCALGAALAAAGKQIIKTDGLMAADQDSEAQSILELLWPHLTSGDIGCSCPNLGCGSKSLSLADMIVHLNDQHYWTREQIAEWVAQFDPPEAADVPHSKAGNSDGDNATQGLAAESCRHGR